MNYINNALVNKCMENITEIFDSNIIYTESVIYNMVSINEVERSKCLITQNTSLAMSLIV